MPTMPEFAPPEQPRADVGALLADAERARRVPTGGQTDHEVEAPYRPGDLASGSPGEPRSLRERGRAALRGPWLAACAGAVLVLAGALVVPAIADARAGTDAQAVLGLVADYVDAIEGGDAAAANAMFLPDDAVASTALLVDEAMPADVDLDVGEVSIDGDRASVDVDVDTSSASFEMPQQVRVSAARDGVGWHLVSGLVTQALVSSGGGLVADIDGVAIDDAIGDRLWLYPGTHVVTPAAGPGLAAASDVGFEVLPGRGPIWLGMVAQPSEALFEQAKALALEFVASCLEHPVAGCPPLDGMQGDATFTWSTASGSGTSTLGNLLITVTVSGVDADGDATDVDLQVTGDVGDGEVASLVVWYEDPSWMDEAAEAAAEEALEAATEAAAADEVIGETDGGDE